MKKLLSGLCALALSAGLVTACSESKNDRLGERPAPSTPSASPPTTPPPAATTPPATPPSTTDSGSSSSGTKQ